MRKVEAIIRSGKLEAVKEALNRFGIQGMTVSQVMGCGLQGGRTEVYRGHEYSINLLPKVKVEIVIRDQEAGKVADIIAQAARTGQVGDGKIFVYPADNAIRVRTGETNGAAILKQPDEEKGVRYAKGDTDKIKTNYILRLTY